MVTSMAPLGVLSVRNWSNPCKRKAVENAVSGFSVKSRNMTPPERNSTPTMSVLQSTPPESQSPISKRPGETRVTCQVSFPSVQRPSMERSSLMTSFE